MGIFFQLGQATPITASGNSPVFGQSGQNGNLVVAFEVTAAPTGTSPSLTAQLQGSADGVTWYNIGAATAAITAAGATRLANTTVLEPYLRLAYTVTGTTPSFPVAVYVMES